MNPEELKDHALDRLKQPFLGTFTILLILANWEAFLYSFTGSINPSERMNGIQSAILKSDYWRSLGFPFTWALLFAFVFPLGSAVANFWFNYIKILTENAKAKSFEKNNTRDSNVRSKSIEAILKLQNKIRSMSGRLDNAGKFAMKPDVANLIQETKHNLGILDARLKELETGLSALDKTVIEKMLADTSIN